MTTEPALARPGRGAPRAYATPLPPAGRRTLTWLTYTCPYCAGIHLGRASDPAALEGVRRGGCGRLVELVLAPAQDGGRGVHR